jgi:anti-sigma regulatory factor (Ser/Thr protein kinase)
VTVSSAPAERLDLAGDVTSVGEARTLVRDSLQRWHLDGLSDTAALLLSELATNAVLHARSAYTVTVERRPDAVRVTVHDRSPVAPARRRHGLRAATGRGLALVETLAHDWGSCDSELGLAKAVWFELSTGLGAQSGAAEGALYGEDWLAIAEDL